MVNLPPDSDDGQPPSRLQGNDEAIAVAISVLAVGTILWWGWTRGQRAFAPSVTAPSVIDESLIETEPLLGFETGDRDGSDPNGRSARFGEDRADADSSLAGESNRQTGIMQRTTSPTSETGASETGDPATDSREPGTAAVESDDPSAVTGTRPTPDEAAVSDEALEAPAVSDEAPTVPDEAPTDVPTETPTAPQTPPPLDISDVADDYWAYPYIVELYEKGLLPDLPDGQLQPDRQLTRAEFAALLNSSFVQNEPGQRDLAFADIAQDYWAADAIRQVVDAGYMSGYPDGEFKPDQLVPRYQVFITMASGLNLADSADPQAVLGGLEGYPDIPEWARAKVAAAAENRILVNYPNPQALAPQQPATRGEIIVMIHQALLNQGRVDEINSPYVNPQN